MYVENFSVSLLIKSRSYAKAEVKEAVKQKEQGDTQGGSDGSAASGGRSDLSEWPRSIADDGFSKPRKISGTATGHLQFLAAKKVTLRSNQR